MKSKKNQIQEADKKAEKDPEKIKPSWDAARTRLELYFDMNIRQVNFIFWLSVTVMILGFGIVIFGITQAMTSEATLPAIIASSAGIIMEIIGATFMVMYKSTMEHAGSYTKTLERMNSVGMAMQILDTMPDDPDQGALKNTTKTEVIKILMQQAHTPEEQATSKQP